jgi:hypothetical protein
LLLAKQAVELGQFKSTRKAAQASTVPGSILTRCFHSKASKEQEIPLVKKLISIEESMLLYQILDLDS